MLIQDLAQLRGECAKWRNSGLSIALVPTMGFFHEGHASLMRKAGALADKVVVSLFVNPTQFGPKEDLSSYPRDFERDSALAAANGVDVIFMPSVELMYPEGFDTWVEVPGLAQRLCGLTRPTHFRGVCTVVLKLLNLVAPDVAVFGEKDWQQLAIIRRMARDLNLTPRIEGAPLVREADGLALSSRNSYLTPQERAVAPSFYKGLAQGRALYQSGQRDAAAIKQAISEYWAAHFPQGTVDYLHIIDGPTLEEKTLADDNCRAIAAVYLGKARLIDNISLAEKA